MVAYPTDISVGRILDPRNAVKSLNFSSGHSLSDTILMENFLLLNTGSRNASMFYIESNNQGKEASKLAKELGLGFKIKTTYKQNPFARYVIPSLQRAFTFIHEDDKQRIEALHPNLSPTDMNLPIDVMSQYSPILHKKIGSIIGYDDCCVSALIEELYSFVKSEERILDQTRLYREKGREVNSDCFYADEFIPCKPNCENAAAKGARFENDLRNQVGDSIANHYRKIKSEHLRFEESGDFFRKTEESNKRSGPFIGFNLTS